MAKYHNFYQPTVKRYFTTNTENRLEKFKENNPKLELSYKDYGTFFQIAQLEKEQSILEVNDKYYKALLNYLTSHDDIEKIVAPSAMGITTRF